MVSRNGGLSLRCVWYVANADGLTASEVAEIDDANVHSVRETLRALYKQGIAVRRVRETESHGKDPYEYRLSRPSEVEFPAPGETMCATTDGE